MSCRAACTEPMRRRLMAPSLAALVCLWPSGLLHGQSRYARHFGVEEGLVPSYIVSLAQDLDDLLWIGTAGGLYRYDGVEMQRWASETLLSWISAISVSPTGSTVVLDEQDGRVFEVIPDGARPIRGPDTGPLRGVHHLTFDNTGTLWVLTDEALLSRDRAGRWAAHDRSGLDGTWLHRVVAVHSGAAMVLTDVAIWRVRTDAPPLRIADVYLPRDVLELPDGRLIVFTAASVLLSIGDGRKTVLFQGRGRGIEFTERMGTFWLSSDRYLVALEPGRAPEILDHDDDLASGGPLLVDHEGSLWLGTGADLMHFPEPDTRIWTQQDGLPSNHTRFLERSGDTTFVDTWQGTGAIARSGGAWNARAVEEWQSSRRVFADGTGELWVGSPYPSPGLLRTGAAGVYWRHDDPVLLDTFTEWDDGSLWFGTHMGLLATSTKQTRPVRLTGLPFPSDSLRINGVLQDRVGRTWLASGRTVCHARDVNPINLALAAWTCGEVPSGHHVNSLVEMPSGDIWASLVRGDVWRSRSGEWRMLGGNRDLVSIDVAGLVPSPRGGVWIVGVASCIRVIEDLESNAGWEVVEELSTRHGIARSGGADVLEEADGTLWLAGVDGVARIPARARARRGPPRRVVMVGAWVDDEPVASGRILTLPHNRNRLTLRFAAASYRDPSRLTYQVRLSEADPWTPVVGPPEFRWVGLGPGRYRAEVRASLDGREWTPETARFAFRVSPPPYFTSWALALYALAAVALVTLAYRARVAFLLRLERQRTRLAMDLHDQMGSGLGSIGILSGVLAKGDGGPDRRRLAKQIAETCQELGTALSDMVWSLGHASSTLDEVAARLAEHGMRLFSTDSAEFTARFPSAWPSTPLAFPKRHAILLIGLEALHNAARHAEARHVSLTIQPADSAWRLVVEDDGIGLPEPMREGDGTGSGLQNLRRRAKEMDGRIQWASRPEGGTRVSLSFSLSSRSPATQ